MGHQAPRYINYTMQSLNGMTTTITTTTTPDTSPPVMGANGCGSGTVGLAAGVRKREGVPPRRRPKQEETDESSLSEQEESEEEEHATPQPNAEACAELQGEETEPQSGSMSAERRLRRCWEREQREIAWRWTWLQLQVAELVRQSRECDRLDRKWRARQPATASAATESKKNDPSLSRRKLQRPPSRTKPPPPPFDKDAPHPLFSLPGLYANRETPSRQSSDDKEEPVESASSMAAVEESVALPTNSLNDCKRFATDQPPAAAKNEKGKSKKKRKEAKKKKKEEEITLVSESLQNDPDWTERRIGAKTFPGYSGREHLKHLQETQKHKKKKRRQKHNYLRSSDFDINSYISLGSSSTIITDQLRKEEIFTPTWRISADAVPADSGTGGVSSSEEDTSDETFALRHFGLELVERRRYLAPKLEKQRKRKRRQENKGLQSGLVQGKAGSGDEDPTANEANGGKDRAVPMRRNGLARAHMSQLISDLASKLPSKNEPHSSNQESSGSTASQNGDEEPYRKRFLLENFALARETYLNADRNENQPWQPPSPSELASLPERHGLEDTEYMDTTGDKTVNSGGPAEGRRFVYYEDMGYNMFDEEEEDGGEDDDEDLFMPDNSVGSRKRKSRLKEAKGNQRPRGKGGKGLRMERTGMAQNRHARRDSWIVQMVSDEENLESEEEEGEEEDECHWDCTEEEEDPPGNRWEIVHRTKRSQEAEPRRNVIVLRRVQDLCN